MVMIRVARRRLRPFYEVAGNICRKETMWFVWWGVLSHERKGAVQGGRYMALETLITVSDDLIILRSAVLGA